MQLSVVRVDIGNRQLRFVPNCSTLGASGLLLGEQIMSENSESAQFIKTMALQLARMSEQLGLETAAYSLGIAALSIDEDLAKSQRHKRTG